MGGEGINYKVKNNILFVKSRFAMSGYLNAPSPFDEEGWYNTGDMVEINGEYLKILGRNSEIINVGGEKVYPAEVEDILLGLSNVKDVIVKGKSNPLVGQIVSAIFHLKEEELIADFRKRMTSYCRNKMEAFKIPRIIRISKEGFMGDRLKKARSEVEV